MTTRGQDEAVVRSAGEFQRLKGQQTGQALVEAMQSSPCREIDLDLASVASPVRDVAL